jgi:hypothetical protein
VEYDKAAYNILFYFILLLLDIILFTTFRDLMFSFLLSKRNKKGAKKIHQSQDPSNRFTFNYVKDHAIYKKEFNFFHKFYIANLFFTPVHSNHRLKKYHKHRYRKVYSSRGHRNRFRRCKRHRYTRKRVCDRAQHQIYGIYS